MADPKYSAAKAATVGLLIAIVTAVLLGIAGYTFVRAGEGVGWLLILLGLLPLIFAVVIRGRVQPPGGNGNRRGS